MVRTAIMALSAMAAAALVTSALAADEVAATSRIDAVELYPDGATVSRLVTAQVKAGEAVIVVGDLPLGLDPNSVRVEGTAGDAVEIISVDTRRVDPLPGDKKTEIDEQIETLKAERKALADVVATTEDQIDYVRSVAKEAPRDLFSARRQGGDGDWQGLLTSVGSELARLREQLRDTRKKDQDLADAITRLEKQREDQWPPARPTMEATITVVADAATDVALTLRYATGDASWTPIYDARLSLADKEPSLTLVRRAAIRQWTGEAWNDVRLTLSTARPGGGTAAPTLPSLIVRIAPPAPPAAPKTMMRNKMAIQRSADEMAGAVADVAMAPEPVAERGARIDTRGFDVVYEIPGRVALDGDGTEKKVKITEDAPRPDVVVRAVPEQDTTAYLSVRFTNEGAGPILPGDVQLFRDGVFVGTGSFDLVAPRDEAKLGFGADPAVVVKRVVLTREEGERGILSSDKTDTRQFKITVANHHEQPIRIEVEDRLPKAENEKITVEPSDGMTKPTVTDPDDRRGIVVWSDIYKAGETRDILFGYRVRWPANERLIWREGR